MWVNGGIRVGRIHDTLFVTADQPRFLSQRGFSKIYALVCVSTTVAFPGWVVRVTRELPSWLLDSIIGNSGLEKVLRLLLR